MIREVLARRGYHYAPMPVTSRFLPAVRAGNLVYVSGQVPRLGDLEIKGKVGQDIDLPEAKAAAEICAFNCLCAIGAVADLESIVQIVKVNGMVNVADWFNDTPGVIDGCSEFLRDVLGERAGHTRVAVGLVLPSNWAVEIDLIAEVN